MVAAEAAVPVFLTVADRVIALVSLGDAGVQLARGDRRGRGSGPGVPTTWNSATCPPGAPVLAVKLQLYVGRPAA